SLDQLEIFLRGSRNSGRSAEWIYRLVVHYSVAVVAGGKTSTRVSGLINCVLEKTGGAAPLLMHLHFRRGFQYTSGRQTPLEAGEELWMLTLFSTETLYCVQQTMLARILRKYSRPEAVVFSNETPPTRLHLRVDKKLGSRVHLLARKA
ncbi:hypothetical protein F441_11119, partial [Phytophthora nicotianae CJ01A1]